MTYSDAIIKRLTDLCVERGITTNKLATLSGITQSTLNSMMRGETKNPKLKTLRKIAMGFRHRESSESREKKILSGTEK